MSGAAWQVTRWPRSAVLSTSALAAVPVIGAVLPFLRSATLIQQLTTLLILVLLAVTWNALAGYAGLVSVGQQAFIGLGAYGTILLVDKGVPVFGAMLLAVLACGVLAVPLSLLVLRLRGGQFAIGTWVVAEAIALVVALDQTLGGGTGTSLRGMAGIDPVVRRALVYWYVLAVAVATLIGLFVLLRSNLGLALQAIRDDEEAAASLGVQVMTGKRVLYVVAAMGSAAAGTAILANTLFIQPQSIFGVQWAAYMIFMVLVGGLGTFEGPLLGAVVFYLAQQLFADFGAWYLIGLGAVAIGFALVLPRGLWGLLEGRMGRRLTPIGYWVVPATPGKDHASASASAPAQAPAGLAAED
jgi:branched-chain amino acid transport system permease protein